MAPLARIRKFWFPPFKLLIAFVFSMVAIFLFLDLFDPHITYDPKEWDHSGDPKLLKLIQLIMKLVKGRL